MSETKQKHGAITESTIARMAGNIAAGAQFDPTNPDAVILIAQRSVMVARAIAAEVQRTRVEE